MSSKGYVDLMNKQITLEVIASSEEEKIYDLDKAIFDLNGKIDLLSSKADTMDCFIAAGSGLLCGLMDVFWVGKFDLSQGRSFASEKVDEFVQETSHLIGCEKTEISECVEFLENKYPIPADGNTPDFGGGLQHHLRDFAHHPTVVGLLFSVLTQFTEKSYGTDVNGNFIIVDIPERSRAFIGKDTVSKIFNGTVIWFFHMVSDMAGSKETAGLSGGTGLPGPILSLAKELSVLPFIKGLHIGEYALSEFLSKLFNGTLLAKHDEKGKIIRDSVLKMDLRGELGFSAELGKQAIPVIVNEVIVRSFYFIRRLGTEIKKKKVTVIPNLKRIDWKSVLPYNSPALTRMLTISTAVFTSVDISDAIISQKYWISINYIGVGRFAVAIGDEIVWALKRRDVQAVRKMYEDIKRNVFQEEDNRLYKRIQNDMNEDRFGLSLEQTEILYNLEYHKTKNDIENTKLLIGNEKIKALKEQWLKEWADYIVGGYEGFVQVKGAALHWYTIDELKERINRMNPQATWYKLALLEAMLFEPFYPLSTEIDKKGRNIPSKKYSSLEKPGVGYQKNADDMFLERVFAAHYCPSGFIRRLRRCYQKVQNELNEVLKTRLTTVSIGLLIAVAVTFTAGAFASQIAVALVGSKFVGISGAALTNTCLAYLGGGAIAAGGAGMAGGTFAIVGGGAILGLGAGTGVAGIATAISLGGKENTIKQSAKLMVAIQEIFLNEEHDIEYSTTIYDRYVSQITQIEKGLVELRLKADVASKEEKKALKLQIEKLEESVKAMKIAMKSMNRVIGSYKVG